MICYRASWVILLLFSISIAHAQPSEEAFPRRPDVRMFEAMPLIKQARQAVRDGELALTTLDVFMDDGIAVLWGGVPSEQLALSAVKKLQEIEGIKDVRTEVYLHSNPRRLLTGLVRPRPAETIVSAKPTTLPEPKADEKNEPAALTMPSMAEVPPPPKEIVKVADVPKEVETPKMSTATKEPRPKIVEVSKVSESGPTLAQRIASVKRANRFFAQIDVYLNEEGLITVIRTDANRNNADLLAKRLGELPGARGVRIRDQ